MLQVLVSDTGVARGDKVISIIYHPIFIYYRPLRHAQRASRILAALGGPPRILASSALWEARCPGHPLMGEQVAAGIRRAGRSVVEVGGALRPVMCAHLSLSGARYVLTDPAN
eukprot:SAG31_NODE_974_length_10627_cov_11.246201_10_plen_113_part_00